MQIGLNGVDRQANREQQMQHIEMQRMALDEQRLEVKPETAKFRDGRMSDREYANYEQSQLQRLKENLLERIAANSKWLSQFDLAQAEEFASEDAVYKQRLDEAKRRQQLLREGKIIQTVKDEVPEKLSKLDALRLRQAQIQKNVQENYQENNFVEENYQEEAQTPIQQQLVIQANPNQRYLDSSQQTIQQMLLQQQQLFNQMSQPNQQVLQLLLELQNQKNQIEHLKHNQEQQSVKQLQQQIYELEQRLHKDGKSDNQISQIKQLEEERQQLKQQMDEVMKLQTQQIKTAKEQYMENQAKHQQSTQNNNQAKQDIIKSAQTKKKLTMQQIEDRNQERWKLLQMVQFQMNQK